MSKRTRAIQIGVTAAALATTIAACGGNSSSSSSASGNIKTAVSYLPADAASSYSFEFADWNQVEKGLGVNPSRLTSAKAISTLFRPINHLGDLPAGESDYDLGIPDPHRLWGASDVTWDASVVTVGKSEALLAMTGLQPSFNMASIGKHLAGCGFMAKHVSGITIYEGSLANMDQCAGPFGNHIPIFTNYGLDTATHTVLMSSSPDVITAALSAHRADKTSPQVDDLLGQLMGQPAIAFGVGPAFCATLSAPVTFAGRLATPQQVQAAKKAYPPAKPYLAFGYGLSLNSKTETGRIVFEYPDASTAKSALPDREHRLQSGQSLSAQLPYSQMIHFVSGHTSGSSALLQVGPPAGHPLALTQMFGRLDLGFAICG